MIKFEEVHINFDNTTIINNISYHVKEGKFTTFLGRNGCGKSSLINLISANLKASKGQVLIFNEQVSKYNKSSFAKKISYLLQFNKLIDNTTVYDFVKFGRIPHKNFFQKLTLNDYRIIDDSLNKTNLLDFKNRYMNTLSGGEKQRVYLAMCLCQQPEVLILDEPTNHLDIKYQYELLSLIKQINLTSNVTVLCVLHDINQAIKYSDEIVLIKDGSILISGQPKAVISAKNIKTCFGIDAVIHNIDNEIHVDYIVS